MADTHRTGRWLLGFVLIATAFLIFVPRIAQSQDYHLFADTRRVFGIPNFWNVVSNVPFALVGLLGLWKLRGLAARILFAGVLLTCFGSAYYHWAPGDARLLWDRLPMTLVFMSLLAWVLSQGRSSRFGAWLLAVLVIAGVASVLWWRITGDLRPYALVQFGSAFLLLAVTWSTSGRRYYWSVAALYAAAKLTEGYDRALYSAISTSGHTLKHVIAALACYQIFRWMSAAPQGWDRAKLEQSAELRKATTAARTLYRSG
jgi:hypothetical protein